MNHTAGPLAKICLGMLLVQSAGCGPKPSDKPITDVIAALKENDEGARMVAAEQLGEHGQAEASQAVAALTEALKDKSPYVRRAAVQSLGHLGPEARSALPAVQKALKDPDDGVRLAAERAEKEIEGS